MKRIFFILGTLLLANLSIAQWVNQNSGTTKDLNSVIFVDSTTGYAVGDSGIILKTYNGGLLWSTLISGTINNLWSVYFTDINTGYTVGANGTILKTSNAGLNWTKLSSGVPQALYSTFFINQNVGFAVGGGGYGSMGIVLKTTDGGMTWNSKTLGSFSLSCFLSVVFTSPDTGYICGGFDAFQIDAALILQTTNSGESWRKLLFEYSNSKFLGLNSISFNYENMGYVVGTIGRILKSSNIDTIWTEQTSGTSFNLNSVTFTTKTLGITSCYAVGMQGTILKNYNGNDSWVSQTSGTSENLNSVTFVNANKGYIVGDNGIILATPNGGGLGSNEIQGTSSLVKIYPSPTSSNVIIESDRIGEDGYLSILNIYGQAILQKQLKQSKTIFNVVGLPSGVYFVKLSGKKTILVGKFIKE
jgi:photosystem II stability/assembly factor-like uncharacterized protein